MIELYTSDRCSNCHRVVSALGGAQSAANLGVTIRNMSTDSYAAQAGNALRDERGNPPMHMPLLAEDGRFTGQGYDPVITRLRARGLVR